MDHRVIAFDPKMGVPVFAGTAVPVQTLIDYWEGGLPLYEFLIDFPSVRKRQAQQVLAWCASIKKSGKHLATELEALSNSTAFRAL